MSAWAIGCAWNAVSSQFFWVVVEPNRLTDWPEAQDPPRMKRHAILLAAMLSFMIGCSSGAALRALQAGNKADSDGRLDAAAEQYRKAISLDRNLGDAYNNLGLVYAKQGRLDEAMEQWRKAVEMQPGHPRALFNLGRAQEDRGSLSLAEDSYRKSISGDRSNAAAHVNLGNVLKKSGRHQEAEQSYRAALEVHPDFAAAHYNLALLYSRERKYPQALKAFERACALGLEAACLDARRVQRILAPQ